MPALGSTTIAVLVGLGLFVLLLVIGRVLRPMDDDRPPSPRPGPGGPRLPPPRPTLDAGTRTEIDALLARERKIEAIKVLKQATGLGLRDAKEWVEAWDSPEPGAPAGPPESATASAARSADDVLAIEARAVREAAGPIAAVKHVRERTGWGLAEAKRYVDSLG